MLRSFRPRAGDASGVNTPYAREPTADAWVRNARQRAETEAARLWRRSGKRSLPARWPARDLRAVEGSYGKAGFDQGSGAGARRFSLRKVAMSRRMVPGRRESCAGLKRLDSATAASAPPGHRFSGRSKPVRPSGAESYAAPSPSGNGRLPEARRRWRAWR